MKLLKTVVHRSTDQYYLAHLQIINATFEVQMFPKEMEVLAAFMALDKKLTEDDMFNTHARKIVKAKLGGMSAAALSNQLRFLLDKGFLEKHPITNKITVHPAILCEEDWQQYAIKLVEKKEDEIR